MTDCPDAEEAALAEALELWSKWFIVPVGQRKGRFKIIADKTDALLADLSPAAKEILEKAQAHDAMAAELEDAQEELGRLRGILPDARLEVIAAGDPNIEVAHLADLEIRHRAALAGKERGG